MNTATLSSEIDVLGATVTVLLVWNLLLTVAVLGGLWWHHVRISAVKRESVTYEPLAKRLRLIDDRLDGLDSKFDQLSGPDGELATAVELRRATLEDLGSLNGEGGRLDLIENRIAAIEGPEGVAATTAKAHRGLVDELANYKLFSLRGDFDGLVERAEAQWNLDHDMDVLREGYRNDVRALNEKFDGYGTRIDDAGTFEAKVELLAGRMDESDEARKVQAAAIENMTIVVNKIDEVVTSAESIVTVSKMRSLAERVEALENPKSTTTSTELDLPHLSAAMNAESEAQTATVSRRKSAKPNKKRKGKGKK